MDELTTGIHGMGTRPATEKATADVGVKAGGLSDASCKQLASKDCVLCESTHMNA